MEEARGALAQADKADVEKALEKQQLDEIVSCLKMLDRVQKIFIQSVSSKDLQEAAGRRCVLKMTGLRHHDIILFFLVDGAGVKVVDPYDPSVANTWIEAPIDSILRVLKGVLNGDESAFSSEWARGKARIRGKRSFHDGWVFGDTFGRLARTIARYKGRVE